jgi:hypothetical protein
LCFTILAQKTAFFIFPTAAARTGCIATYFCHKNSFSYLAVFGNINIMQLRFATDLSAQQYVRQQAWKDARLFTKQAVVALPGTEPIHVKLRRASKSLDGTAARHTKLLAYCLIVCLHVCPEH